MCVYGGGEVAQGDQACASPVSEGVTFPRKAAVITSGFCCCRVSLTPRDGRSTRLGSCVRACVSVCVCESTCTLPACHVSWMIFLLQLFSTVASPDTVCVTLFPTTDEIASCKGQQLFCTGWFLPPGGGGAAFAGWSALGTKII